MSVELAEQPCQACQEDSPSVSAEEWQAYRAQLPDWQWVTLSQEQAQALERHFHFANFRQAFAFISQIALLAESQGHHPDIEFGWGYAKLRWWTHKIKNVHQSDLILAARSDRIYQGH